MKIKLFVYGTLRKSYGNHSLLTNAHFLGDAKTLNKFVMRCAGQVPFVSESQSISFISGEVYEVDLPTLASIDRLEGCLPLSDNPAAFHPDSWYTRKKVSVQFNNSETIEEVWMYINENENRHPIISSGNYADRNQLLNSTEKVWYFAYGSNMDAAQMIERGVHFTQRKVGVIDHHRLVFNKISGKYPGFGVANIEEDVSFQVQGLLYEVNESALRSLDRFEGVSSGHYFRATMEVFSGDVNPNNDNRVEAIVYMAGPSHIQDGLSPHKDYLKHLHGGLDLLGEEGQKYLELSVKLSRVTDAHPFLQMSDIPVPTTEQYQKDVTQYALPVLIDGIPAKAYIYEGLWSDKLIIYCEPSSIPQFAALGLHFDDLGYFGTKHFEFPRRGILELVDRQFVIERVG